MASSRRQFLASLLAPARPNILLLLADNWAHPHASAYQGGVPTPTFDRLAAEGALFDWAFAPNPSCSPSRSGLLSGQWTHALGPAASLYGLLPEGQPTYTKLLEQAGYHVGHTGKGWGPGWVAGMESNPAGPLFGSFGEFLKKRPAGAPFCFWFGSRDPHVPWTPPADAGPSLIPVPPHLPDVPEVRRDVQAYAGEVQRFDRECGELLALLRERGELDNTLVVMTSDNGWQMPRGLAGCYDLGVRVPLAMRWPRRVAPGRRQDFVSLYDLAPTFLAAAGLPVPGAMRHSRSLLQRTGRKRMYVERERHANVRHGNLSYPVRGVRTTDYLYLHNLQPDRWPAGDPEYYWAVGEYGDVDESSTKRYMMKTQPEPAFSLCFAKRPAEELYHLPTDPGQLRNVAGEPRHGKALRELRADVERWRRETADNRPAAAWDADVYTGPRRRQLEEK